jgi:hypothetical protein
MGETIATENIGYIDMMNTPRQRIRRSVRHHIHSEFAHIDWDSPENVVSPPRVLDWSMPRNRIDFPQSWYERKRAAQEYLRRQEELQGPGQRPKGGNNLRHYRRRQVTPEEYAAVVRQTSRFNFEEHMKKSNEEKDRDLQEHYRRCPGGLRSKTEPAFDRESSLKAQKKRTAALCDKLREDRRRKFTPEENAALSEELKQDRLRVIEYMKMSNEEKDRALQEHFRQFNLLL